MSTLTRRTSPHPVDRPDSTTVEGYGSGPEDDDLHRSLPSLFPAPALTVSGSVCPLSAMIAVRECGQRGERRERGGERKHAFRGAWPITEQRLSTLVT